LQPAIAVFYKAQENQHRPNGGINKAMKADNFAHSFNEKKVANGVFCFCQGIGSPDTFAKRSRKNKQPQLCQGPPIIFLRCGILAGKKNSTAITKHVICPGKKRVKKNKQTMFRS